MIKVNFFASSRYQVNKKLIKEKIGQFLLEHNIKDAAVDISIVGKRKITTLNEKHLQHDGETDVLSFPQHEKHQLNDFPVPDGAEPHLGDIVVSFPEAVKMARRYGKLVDQQIWFYIEHGLLHLLGYHHE